MVIKVVQYTFSHIPYLEIKQIPKDRVLKLFLKLSFMGTQLTHAFEVFMAGSP